MQIANECLQREFNADFGSFETPIVSYNALELFKFPSFIEM